MINNRHIRIYRQRTGRRQTHKPREWVEYGVSRPVTGAIRRKTRRNIAEETGLAPMEAVAGKRYRQVSVGHKLRRQKLVRQENAILLDRNDTPRGDLQNIMTEPRLRLKHKGGDSLLRWCRRLVNFFLSAQDRKLGLAAGRNKRRDKASRLVVDGSALGCLTILFLYHFWRFLSSLPTENTALYMLVALVPFPPCDVMDIIRSKYPGFMNGGGVSRFLFNCYMAGSTGRCYVVEVGCQLGRS